MNLTLSLLKCAEWSGDIEDSTTNKTHCQACLIS